MVTLNVIGDVIAHVPDKNRLPIGRIENRSLDVFIAGRMLRITLEMGELFLSIVHLIEIHEWLVKSDHASTLEHDLLQRARNGSRV